MTTQAPVTHGDTGAFFVPIDRSTQESSRFTPTDPPLPYQPTPTHTDRPGHVPHVSLLPHPTSRVWSDTALLPPDSPSRIAPTQATTTHHRPVLPVSHRPVISRPIAPIRPASSNHYSATHTRQPLSPRPTPTTLFTSPRPIPTADCPAQLQIWSAQPDIPAHRLRAPCRPDQSTRSLSPRPTTRFTPRPAPTTQATTYATHIRLACSALIGTDPTTLKEHT